MSAAAATGNDLQWDVLTIKRPGLTRDLPPGKEDLMWVANSSTLIYGKRDAVLVDTFLTIEQSRTLLDRVVASGKHLVAAEEIVPQLRDGLALERVESPGERAQRLLALPGRPNNVIEPVAAGFLRHHPLLTPLEQTAPLQHHTA